jgi:hypothetical protein
MIAAAHCHLALMLSSTGAYHDDVSSIPRSISAIQNSRSSGVSAIPTLAPWQPSLAHSKSFAQQSCIEVTQPDRQQRTMLRTTLVRAQRSSTRSIQPLLRKHGRIIYDRNASSISSTVARYSSSVSNPPRQDLLEAYRELVSSGRLKWDDEQVRIVMKVRSTPRPSLTAAAPSATRIDGLYPPARTSFSPEAIRSDAS